MKELHLWNFIHEKIAKGKSVILIAVVNHEKGSPGKEGFKMAVASEDDCIGSVGGGIMEYNIIKRSSELIKENAPLNYIEKLFHNKKASSDDSNKSGLICSGSQTNFSILLNNKDLKIVNEIIDIISSYKPGKLVFSNKGIKIIKGKKNSSDHNFEYKSDNNWQYEETIGLKNHVYIVGGGHVGLALSKLMSELEFYVTVYDDRNSLPVNKENKFANKIISAPFNKLGNFITENDQTYIVLVTRNFDSDKECLIQVIEKKVRYIGIMGTKVKIRKIFNEAVKAGISKKKLKKIHAPVGIDINSDTPEEIAVSIAAEIISVKNS